MTGLDEEGGRPTTGGSNIEGEEDDNEEERISQIDHDDDDDDDEISTSNERMVVVMGGSNPEEWPHLVLRGSHADLSALHYEGTYSTFFTGPRELLLSQPEDGIGGIPCLVKWVSDNGDENEESDGRLFITVSQVLFCASSSSLDDMPSSSSSSDWAIGATCIHLHAMADEPEPSIYLQVTEDDGHDGENSLEVTIIPLDPDSCQTVFDGLCKLVARHPLQLDDDNDNGGYEGGGFFGQEGSGFDLDDMIWAPSSAAGGGGMRSTSVVVDDDFEEGSEDSSASVVSNDERAAMLRRLDNMLVVSIPPGDFRGREGQFDDADEDEDDVDYEGDGQSP